MHICLGPLTECKALLTAVFAPLKSRLSVQRSVQRGSSAGTVPGLQAFAKKGCIAHANFNSDIELKNSCKTISFKNKIYENSLKKFWKSKHIVFEDACTSIGKYLAINGISY